MEILAEQQCTSCHLEHNEIRALASVKKMAMDPDKIDRWMVDAFVAAHGSAPEEIVLDLDATDDPIHGHQEGRFFHGYYGNYCYLALHLFGRASYAATDLLDAGDFATSHPAFRP